MVLFRLRISKALEQDSYKRNLIVFDDQMIDSSKDKRIVDLFTHGSHDRNLSEIYIAQNLFHQGKKSQHKPKRSLFAAIQESTRQIAKLDSGQAKVSQALTYFFLNEYEEAVKRPFGYLLIDLKTTTQDNFPLRKNLLASEEGFNQAGYEEDIP